MEMWCPDDTGLNSWDWVGPPVLRGSSRQKTERPQIGLLLFLLLWLLWSAVVAVDAVDVVVVVVGGCFKHEMTTGDVYVHKAPRCSPLKTN